MTTKDPQNHTAEGAQNWREKSKTESHRIVLHQQQRIFNFKSSGHVSSLFPDKIKQLVGSWLENKGRRVAKIGSTNEGLLKFLGNFLKSYLYFI